MGKLEILLGVFSLIICTFYIIVFVISRKTIKKEELLLEKLTAEEIEKIRLKENYSQSALLLNLGITITCCIYLLISIINKGILISFFGEILNKVINSIIIVIILLPHLLERINVIRRYNKVKEMAVNN
ncbi:MAG: hypothetical protein E6510_01945 [Gemella haemolysans]|uniref:hypothetical protein n=1 Tax=Gemella haemolysans TaxID=1379 RepID=UPI00290ABE1C|nr:hypothetical protein [Gemella haemolysans]MDU6572955.1 hypothetical protein [Gemella haemolysans]